MIQLTHKQMQEECGYTTCAVPLQLTLQRLVSDSNLFGQKEKNLSNSLALLKYIYEAVRVVCADPYCSEGQVYSHGDRDQADAIRILGSYGLCDEYQGFSMGIHNAARLKSWEAELPRLSLEFEKLTERIAVPPRFENKYK